MKWTKSRSLDAIYMNQYKSTKQLNINNLQENSTMAVISQRLKWIHFPWVAEFYSHCVSFTIDRRRCEKRHETHFEGPPYRAVQSIAAGGGWCFEDINNHTRSWIDTLTLHTRFFEQRSSTSLVYVRVGIYLVTCDIY